MDGSVELVRMGSEGDGVVLRLTGDEGTNGAVLAGVLVVGTPFVSGHLGVRVLPEDLREWQEALDALDSGQDVDRRAFSHGASLVVERDASAATARVTVEDASVPPTCVTVTVPMDDAWFDDAYERLERVWKTWPATEG
ncbi:DUF5959 family protein [Streptomyces sp. NPDC058867]|uniref:DUF5959 family protein n=1 Tax=unclassified Streptomyces TaxID=2593676 RepID=UPI003675028F